MDAEGGSEGLSIVGCVCGMPQGRERMRVKGVHTDAHMYTQCTCTHVYVCPCVHNACVSMHTNTHMPAHMCTHCIAHIHACTCAHSAHTRLHTCTHRHYTHAPSTHIYMWMHTCAGTHARTRCTGIFTRVRAARTHSPTHGRTELSSLRLHMAGLPKPNGTSNSWGPQGCAEIGLPGGLH